MKKIILIMLFSAVTFAQVPKIDTSFRQEMIDHKASHYQNILLCEQQTTINQNSYDITYYAFDLRPDPNNYTLSGVAEISAVVTNSNLQNVELNFWDGMTINRIYSAENSAVQFDYTRNNDLLTVHLQRTYSTGERFHFVIEYDGRPHESPYGSFAFDSYNNEPMIWTLSSVFGARAWWPCKDVPSDKPDSMDIRVTVPNGLIVASNGVLREKIQNGNHTTWWWHERHPIATYLVSLAIHPYEMHYDDYIYNDGADTMTIEFYSFPGNFEPYRHINGLVKDMLACFADLFGEYPFVDEKYAQADFLWSGGMEHQTCTSYGRWNEALFAHEIAHQWWGDMITCDDFHHIWLNEGFASYAEALWFEYAYPPFSASEYQMMYQLYLGPGTVYVEDPYTENIFDSGLSYVKGSWILHMLRHVVGDDNFFEILKSYYSSQSQYSSATTDDFQEICEQVSGMNLHKFFYQWIHEEFYPRYSFSWNTESNGSGYTIDLQIRQEQSNYVFWMPVDVTVTTTSGEHTFVVWDSVATQSFQLHTNAEPINLELDKDNWILKSMPEEINNPTFDQGILLVNGVNFDTYGEEIWNSYTHKAFWGDASITFWDCFNPTPDGYPATLPQPIGHGKVPGDVLGHYSTVIWVGNDYGGDLGSWQQTSILNYLKAGGNVLLMTRKGRAYIDIDLQNYLGIIWAETPNLTVQNCLSVFPGLQNLSLTGEQSYTDVFQTALSSDESTLLFQETASFAQPRGLAVWRHPVQGGEFRSDGGNFVFISGRPYRYNSDQLQENIQFILHHFMNETTIAGNGPILNFSQNYPNPFHESTTIRYYVDEPSDITIQIYNIQGRLIKDLWQNSPKGFHSIVWDGKNNLGKNVSSGVYFYRLGKSDENKKMVLLR